MFNNLAFIKIDKRLDGFVELIHWNARQEEIVKAVIKNVKK